MNNYTDMSVNILGLIKAAEVVSTGADRVNEIQGINDAMRGSKYKPGDVERLKTEYDAMANDPNVDKKALGQQRQMVETAKANRRRRNKAIRLQSAQNTDDDSIDWRRVDWENSPSSSSIIAVRNERLTPAQHAYYKRKVREYGGDKNRAFKDLQDRLNGAQGSQTWVQTKEDIANQMANQKALSQPASGRWYSSYGDDAELGPGNTIRVKGAPSRALQRAAEARGMTVVSDAGYYGNRGRYQRAADARRANRPRSASGATRASISRPTSVVPRTMDVSGMSDSEVMDWVQNHASEINNAWHSDPYYQNMARRVAAISDPKLFNDARHPVYGVPDDVLNLRIQSLFRDAARPYAEMLRGGSYDPVSSGGFGAYSRGR